MESQSEIMPETARGRSARVWAFVAAGVLLVAIEYLTWRVAQVYPITSDDATGILEANAVIRGNFLLSGWTLSNVSFVTTDLPFYVLAVLLRGVRPSLLRDVPVAFYTVAVAVAAFLARGRHRGLRAYLGALVVLVLLGLPAGGLAEFVTKGYIRVGTTFGFFIALLAIDVPAGRRISPARVGIFTVALTLTLLADSYALLLGALPVMIVCAVGAATSKANDDLGLWTIVIASAGSVATALGLSWLIGACGGFTVVPLPLRDYLPLPDPIGVVFRNVGVLSTNLPSLYRCGFQGDSGGLATAVRLGCLIGPGLLLLALARAAPFSVRHSRVNSVHRGDFISRVLWVSMAIGLLAYVVTGNAKDRGTMRYMIPFVLSGAVLAGRSLVPRVGQARLLIAALVSLGLSYGATVDLDLRKPAAADDEIRLAAELASRGLRHGYGPYWDASIVTVASRNRVAVRPVRVRSTSAATFVIEPFRWMSDERWYSDGPVTFVVYRTKPGSHYDFGINQQSCAAVFGPPAGRYSIGPHTVLVWDHDLRPFLDRGTR